METNKTPHAGGRPTEYTIEITNRANVYLQECVDEIEEFHQTKGEKSNTYRRLVRVRIPTIEGLASYLKISKNTLYDWEKQHKEFSDVMEDLRQKQAHALIQGGLSGDYNPTIAKVLLTKHGYREGIDQTTNDKDMPTPIANVSRNNSLPEDK